MVEGLTAGRTNGVAGFTSGGSSSTSAVIHEFCDFKQLTLREEELYKEISLSEFFGQGWMKKNNADRAKNLLTFIER